MLQKLNIFNNTVYERETVTKLIAPRINKKYKFNFVKINILYKKCRNFFRMIFYFPILAIK